MRKLTALLLVLSMVILPCVSLAQTTTQHYDLTDIGISLDVPADWFTATHATAGNCSLGTAYGFSEADTKALLTSMSASLYAVCNASGTPQMAVVSSTGIGFVDMRDFTLDMDAFMQGFLSSYSGVTDSGTYQTDECLFACVRFSQQDATTGTTSDVYQYVTNVNGKVYVIQMMGLSGVALDAANLAQLKQVVDSLTFIN